MSKRASYLSNKTHVAKSASRRTVKNLLSLKTSKGFSLIHGVNGRDFILEILPIQHKDLAVYKMEYKLANGLMCQNYVDSLNKHIVFKNENEQYVVLHVDGEKIDKKMEANILQKLVSKSGSVKIAKPTITNVSLMKDVILLQSCVPDIDLSRAQEKLEELNVILSKKCKNMFLKLAPFYDFTEPLVRFNEFSNLAVSGNFYDRLILALCTSSPHTKCVSIIELMISKEGDITILSKTIEEYEGKKYNKLLRFVLSILANHIPNIRAIKSVAINKVSAWLLIKYFNARVDMGNPFETFIRERGIESKNIQLSTLDEYYSVKREPIHLTVDVNRENEEQSFSEFKKLTSGASPNNQVKCE
jgi:hypothetical protein